MGELAVEGANTPSLTSDFILDETAPLSKVRGLGYVLPDFFDNLDRSRALRIVRIDSDRFDSSREFFLKQSNHVYHFTDCSSFIVMKEYKIDNVLTHDRHFTRAGFKILLP